MMEDKPMTNKANITPKKRILVADDSRLSLRLSSSLLTRGGYEVITASDGFEAIQSAYEQRPDLIVLDVMMPLINGYQVCRLLKSDPSTRAIPIIMLTAKTQRTDRYWGLSTGAEGYITKGHEQDELLIRVQGLLEQVSVPTNVDMAREKVHKETTPFDILARVNNLLDRRLYEATIMNEITQLASPMMDCHETVRTAVQKIAQMFGIEAAALLFQAENETTLHIVPIYPLSEAYLSTLEETALQRSLDQGIPTSHVLRSFAPMPQGSQPQRVSFHTVYSVPVLRGDKKVGVFVITGDEQLLVGPEDERTLRLLTSQAAVVIDNARLYEKIQRMAITDGLTGIFNRSHFLSLVEQEIIRSKRYNRHFSLMMLDVDHFKRVNDTFGHQDGDRVLQALVTQCEEGLRETDDLGRYGGEEFMVLLPETDLNQAHNVADRIRESIAGMTTHTKRGAIHVTVSIGVVAWPECGTNDSDAMIAKVDAALYQAKNEGRNLVVAVT